MQAANTVLKVAYCRRIASGDRRGAAFAEFAAEVVVLDGKHVHDAGERLARRAVAVAFLPQALDLALSAAISSRSLISLAGMPLRALTSA